MPVKIYLRTAIISMLTLGVMWGIYLLVQLAIGLEFTGLNVLEVDAHGIAQIYGWIAMGVVGASSYLLPRLLQKELPSAYLIYPIWISLVAGTAVSILALLLPAFSFLIVPGGALIVLGTLLFLRQMWPLVRSFLYLKTALVCLVVSAIYSLWHHAALVAAPSREDLLFQVATFQAPLRDLQVHGVGLFMILAVMQLFFFKTKESFKAWILLLCGVVGEVLIFLVYRYTGVHAIAAFLLLPWLLLLGGSALLLVKGGGMTKLPLFGRLASLWLLLSLVMLVLLPLYSLVSGQAFSHAYYGAIRHAVTVGFISQMMMGMMASFFGRPFEGLSLALINVGCFTRVLVQILTDFSLPAFWILPTSGVIEFSSLLLWGLPLLKRRSLIQDVKVTSS